MSRRELVIAGVSAAGLIVMAVLAASLPVTPLTDEPTLTGPRTVQVTTP